ncbi:MAG: hypothetical protein E6713_06125 [Sporomusaceae bacterium]|nr:hypothetical protein [Sporomusaceae bacterium]
MDNCRHERFDRIFGKFSLGNRAYISISKAVCLGCGKTEDEIKLEAENAELKRQVEVSGKAFEAMQEEKIVPKEKLVDAEFNRDVWMNNCLTAEEKLVKAEKVCEAAALYVKFGDSPVCVGWDDLIKALADWRGTDEQK